MSENTNTYDRRTMKTRKAIIDALADLLYEKELHKVTVKEITEKADINRGTFYKHYLDVYDLYDKAEQDILVDLGMLVLQLEELPSDQFFTHLVNYIDDNRAIFRMMFSPNSTSKLRDRFNRCLEGSFRQVEAEKKDKSASDITLRYQTRMCCHHRSLGQRRLHGAEGLHRKDALRARLQHREVYLKDKIIRLCYSNNRIYVHPLSGIWPRLLTPDRFF